MKVLVVDDSYVVRYSMDKALKKAGITDVTQAANGEEAVRKFLAGKFDLVMMDYHMPKMGGVEAVKEIRATGSKVPIIMVTTEIEKTHILKALQAGASNYIVKPFTDQMVIDKIKETFLRMTKRK
ncbi:MAG: response regulator [bacterium]|nr:response regulator [bacterium]